MANHTSIDGPLAAEAASSFRASDENAHMEIVALGGEKAKPNSAPRARKRVRRPALMPSLDILLATKSHTYKEVGANAGISKQRVGQIARRWREYLPVRPLPAPTWLEREG